MQKTPAPIPFPEQPAATRNHLDRAAAHVREQLRTSAAVTAAAANGREAGYQEGYVAGTQWGQWIGACIGSAIGVVATAGFYALRAWSATL